MSVMIPLLEIFRVLESAGGLDISDEQFEKILVEQEIDAYYEFIASQYND